MLCTALVLLSATVHNTTLAFLWIPALTCSYLPIMQPKTVQALERGYYECASTQFHPAFHHLQYEYCKQ